MPPWGQGTLHLECGLILGFITWRSANRHLQSCRLGDNLRVEPVSDYVLRLYKWPPRDSCMVKGPVCMVPPLGDPHMSISTVSLPERVSFPCKSKRHDYQCYFNHKYYYSYNYNQSYYSYNHKSYYSYNHKSYYSYNQTKHNYHTNNNNAHHHQHHHYKTSTSSTNSSHPDWPRRLVSKTRADENVQAEVELVFNQTSTEPIPTNNAIVETLKEAAIASNSTLNLIVDVNTITVIKSLQIIPLRILTNGTFVAALSNSSSNEFQTRASTIKKGLEPYFIADYPGLFSILTVTSFSDANVKTRSVPTIRNSMDLAFAANTLLPNSTQIVNTIVRAAKNNTLPFQIFTNEIVINGTAFSSAEVSRKISVLTALLLVAVSLLVPWFD
ncbi:uncharacterized protein [Pseudorasbora parva]|uniref:uncharacterized protein n=1 Tax=Pseudorasbora parva TaxID=51549 RepID=UPI00351E141C